VRNLGRQGSRLPGAVGSHNDPRLEFRVDSAVAGLDKAPIALSLGDQFGYSPGLAHIDTGRSSTIKQQSIQVFTAQGPTPRFRVDCYLRQPCGEDSPTGKKADALHRGTSGLQETFRDTQM